MNEEPSFIRFESSTPARKPHPSSHSTGTGGGFTLRESDTESIDDDSEDGQSRGQQEEGGRTRPRLTRRTLNQIQSKTHLQSSTSTIHSSSAIQIKPTAIRPLMMSRDHSIQSNSIYAPTPSTGSSTLVEPSDYNSLSSYSKLEKGKGKAVGTTSPGRGTTTGTGTGRARGRGTVINEDSHEDEAGEEEGAEDASSSSPRRKPKSRGRGVSAYLDSHQSALSTPPPSHTRPFSSSLLQHQQPNTPLAPGAYPPTARKPRTSHPPLASSSPPTNSNTNGRTTQTPPSTTSAPQQIRDIFNRVIHAPLSAERERDLNRRNSPSHLQHSQSQSSPPPPPRETRLEPPTPHGPGHYNFSPQPSQTAQHSRSPIPSSASTNRNRVVRWGRNQFAEGGNAVKSGEEASDEESGSEEEEDEEEEEGRGGTPSRMGETDPKL
ncbi:hypothetical protein P7C70_g9414, partial [Phenoliferia sp. Uapishka_3]